ncbi:MAG TPA: hypothetical protein VFG73_11540, partial [Rhodanobacteraceae bacterium]|nr:hypothetical protein [Rhodanobacteraceae bacterium]
TGILTLVSAGSTATLAQWQAALRSVSYADFSENPDTSTRTISFTVNDRAANSVAAGRTLAVVAVNDAPVITTSGGITNYTGGSAAVTIDAGVTVSDVDNSTQSSATVAIGSGFHSGDSLGFTNTSAATYGNIAASYNAATGVLTMTSSGATATNAQWAGALSSVTFASTSTSYGARTVAFVVADGASSSAAATDTIAMSGVPTVTNVGSATPDGRYKIGDTIYLTVSFDQAVTVDTAGGSPTLLLETGSVDRDAPYVSGSGSTTLTFAYSVLPGDASPDLDYATTSALALNGATIRSAGGADAVLTLPATGSATSIAGQRAIVVDGVAPTVVSVNVPANGTYGVSQNLDFTVNYGEAVTVNTGGGMPRLAITLDTGGTVHADYVSGSGTTALVFRMTVVVGERDADGITVGATLESNGASIGDAAGNDAEPALNGVGSTSAVLIDTPVADLGVDVDDGGDYARYGKIRNYLVTIVNAGDGDAIGASISSSYSPGLDAANTHWKCFGGGLASVPDVAHCEPSSGAGSVASTIDLPAGTSLGFLVSVPVTVEAADPDVQVGIAVTGSASNVSLGASDTDTLVLFRDGFDAIYADGTQMVAQPVSLATATLSPCAEETTLMGTEPPLVELSREPAEAMVDRLFDTRVSGGRQVAVERTNLGVRPWVRLVTSGADGERASAWTASDAGATLALGLADDGTSQWLLLEGRTASLRQMLPPEDASTSDACR